jgi:2-octaprenyl-6-methoxyphenol hydroxylase
MTNIVILGAGLSGEITALAFASKGIKTLLLEASDLKFPKDGRTIALTNLSKSFLDRIGIWSSLEPYISDIKDVYVADDFSPRMLHLSESKNNYQALGYMIESYNLREVIHNLVLSNPLITFKTSINYELLDSGAEGKAILQIADNKITADLIVICDGRNSKIRREYFVDSFNKDYKQSALTFHVEHTKMHENTAVEHFMNRGVFAILPLRNQYQSAIVWAEKSELAEIYKDMCPEEFLPHLQKRFGDFLGEVKVTTPIQSYPLTARITKNYYYNKLILVADSAHNIHPLAGQGLNQGIKDIESLVSIASRNYSVGLEFDKLAGEEYERSRKSDNYAMFLLTDNLNRIFSNNIPILRHLRKVGLSMIDRMSFLKKRLVK